MTTASSSRVGSGLGRSTWLAFAAAVVATYFGWRLLWHMADDAYITYRYVSNAMLGRGLVWNPAPFLPVDGNTDFLWSLLLLLTWKVTGLEPPEVANTFALLFGCGTLFLLARATARRSLPEPLRPLRWLVVALVLGSVASNRAFLASLSSGLGVAIFNFLIFAWVLIAGSPHTLATPRRWPLLGACAGSCGVARPEGHLVVLATCVLVSLWGLPSREGRRRAGLAIAAAVLPVLAHLLWRRLTVGDWMPCTYHAKTVEAWPESGVRFFGSFVVEFGVYVWLAVALVWLAKKARHPGPLALLRREHLGPAAAASVLLFHFGYYTFFMGGDLFEWRVYSHLIPLLPLLLVHMAADLVPSRGFVVGALGAFALLSQPVAWVKYANDDGAVAPHLPAMLGPLVKPYDEWQRWLNERAVCMRNFHMKVNFDVFVRKAPTREEGQRITLDGFPVHASPTVGVVGWVLPNVAIIDVLGLNDAVIARTPVPTAAERLAQRTRQMTGEFEAFDKDRDRIVTLQELEPFVAAMHPELAAGSAELRQAAANMLRGYDTDRDGSVRRDEYIDRARLHSDRVLAHERVPPPGYVEGFQPNVDVWNGTVTIKPRAVPLSEQDIRQHEAAFRARFGAPH